MLLKIKQKIAKVIPLNGHGNPKIIINGWQINYNTLLGDLLTVSKHFIYNKPL